MVRRLFAVVLAGVLLTSSLPATPASAAMTVAMTSTGTDAANRTMAVGATLAFNVSVSGGTAKSIRWWTDDTAIASVSGSGSQVSVKALREGVTKLWVEVTDSAGKKYTDFCWVNGATDVPDTPNSIVLKGAALYRSRHTSATSRGVLTANAPATVMAISQTWVRVLFADSFVFPADNAQTGRDAWVLKSSVHIPATSMSVTPKTLIVEKGKTGSFSGTTLQTYANDVKVSWSSSSNGIATVSTAGTLTGVAEGVVTVTATAASSHGAKVTDTAVTSVYTSMAALAGKANTATSARAAANTSAAVVVGLASGGAVLVVGACGSYYLVDIGGKRGFVPKSAISISATSVSVNKSTASLQPGQQATITATVKPDLATNKAVTWASSDTSVATVSSAGVVTAVADGTATVTVTTVDGGKTATTKVTVIANVVHVTGVILNKTATSLTPGGSETLVATVLPADATNKTASWRSSNTGVATVSNSGVVTAKEVGSATITVTTDDGDKTASATVTVKSTAVRVTGVTLNKTSTTMAVGSTMTLIATVLPSTATNKAVSWSSSNSKVATVSSTGMVTGKAAGTATVTVKTSDGGKTATARITVVVVRVAGVTLNKTSAGLAVGGSTQLVATVLPTNASNRAVSWSTSNGKVATVSPAGLVTGKGVGTATVTVKTSDGGKTAKATITVRVPVTSVSLPAKATVRAGATITLTPTVKPSNATHKTVTWTSSNTKTATVATSRSSTATTPKADITGKAAGTVKVTVKTADGGKTATTTLTVTAKPTLSLTGSMTIPNPLKQGTPVPVKGTVKSNYPIAKVTAKIVTSAGKTLYSPSATPKATSYNTANLDAKLPFRNLAPAKYRYVVVATDIDGAAKTLRTTKFTVTKPTIKVTGVTLNKTSLTLNVGATSTLTATVVPSNATNKKVTWTSSKTNIATVNGGKVIAKGAGTTTITVKTTDGIKTATVKVTVVPNRPPANPSRPTQEVTSVTSAWGWSCQEWFSQLGYDGSVWFWTNHALMIDGSVKRAQEAWLRFYAGRPGNRDTGKLYADRTASQPALYKKDHSYWDDFSWDPGYKTIFKVGIVIKAI